MLLKGYSLEIFKSKCDAKALGVQCFVHLDDDIRDVLPYLNAKLGGFTYVDDPPSLTLKIHGKLLTFHPRIIAINALHDRDEAEKIAGWLLREINETWEQRQTIEPSRASGQRPVLLEVLKLLPKTNCGKCSVATCMVFASLVIEGGRDANGCPEISKENRQKLASYLARFSFD